MMSLSFFVDLLVLCIAMIQHDTFAAPEQFRFGNTQGDYMVLQKQPERAQIWGFSSPNDLITITLSYQSNSKVIETINTTANGLNSTWKTYLSPQPAQNDIEYIITATSNTLSKTISLSHILFGDVFFCSGQSNMGFTVYSAFNSTAEIQAANNFPNIRLIQVHGHAMPIPQLESAIYLPWSIANSTSIGNGNFTYFSAVCWFYGRDLYEYLQYPIGLIKGSNGGTPIRCFMSDEARLLCNETAENCINSTNKITDSPDSGFWNGMIYPFLQTTIRGAIWYQGEKDSSEPYCARQYVCAMPSLINSWRKYWHSMSDTDALFPFGLVQLSTWDDNTQNATCTSANQTDSDDCYDVAIVRWGQSGNYGYLPNKIMLNTFMVGAIDLGDPTSPWGDVHPRYKQAVGRRLADAAMNVIYGETKIYFGGPIAETFTVDVDNNMVMIGFRNVGEMGLQIKNYQGFEFYTGGTWLTPNNITFKTNGNYKINIVLESNLVNTMQMVRFLWFHAPCYSVIGPFNCPIYDKQYQLPALPFIMNLTTS
eukprot:427372_1